MKKKYLYWAIGLIIVVIVGIKVKDWVIREWAVAFVRGYAGG